MPVTEVHEAIEHLEDAVAETWKIGELAKRTGLTVRTLHHYDETGLLSPRSRTAAGHRLYGLPELERLQRIRSLRHLGLSLDEIGRCLDRPGYELGNVLRMHAERLERRIREQEALRSTILRLTERADRLDGLSGEDLLTTLEALTMFEKYYTPEQLDQLEARRRKLGEERIREVESEWPTLIAEVRSEMERGTDPSDPRVRELARRWQELVLEFTGGDPGITAALGRMYREEQSVQETAGLSPAVFEYVQRAAKSES